MHLTGWIQAIRSKTRLGAEPPKEFVALDHLLHDMRLYKSAAEVRVMQAAADISAEAHVRAMQACRPGMYEYQLEAELQYTFMRHGSRAPAYSSIVAAGANACILHYTENTAQIRDGDLVLIDAGCELDCYASDITRTFPANGRFSPEQRAIYDLVLRAQAAAFEAIGPGRTWNEAHDATVRVITEGLAPLGLLAGDPEALIASGDFRPPSMHHAVPPPVMDVIDVREYRVGGEWRVLEPGRVMTVEPGIYIAPDNQQVAARWRGIGIRIEDDVLVTRDGHQILTGKVPREADEIEALMAAARTAASVPA